MGLEEWSVEDEARMRRKAAFLATAATVVLLFVVALIVLSLVGFWIAKEIGVFEG